MVARSGILQFGALLTLSMSVSLWSSAGHAYTEDQQQACTGDAFRLCGPDIPDVDRVTACMVRQRAQLSPGCAVYFRDTPEVLTPVVAQKTTRTKPRAVRKAKKPQRAE